MSDLGKNVRFYCETMLMNALKTVVMVAVMAVFLVMLEGGDKESVSKIVPTYLLMFLVMTNFISAMNAIRAYLPMTISLGSTRRSSFWGLLISEHVLNVLLAVFIYVCHYFISYEMFEKLWMPFVLSVIGFLFIMIGLGNLVGVITLKYGNTKGMIAYVILILLIIGAVAVFILAGAFDWITPGSTVESLLRGPLILILGLIVDAVIGWISYKVIRKSDLQM